LEHLGVPDQVVIDGLGQDSPLVVAGGLVAVDVRQAHADQDCADVLVLELYGAFRASVQERLQRPVVVGLAVGLPGEFGPEHQEVVGDDQIDFVPRPVPSPLRGFFSQLDHRPGVLLLDGKPESSQHEVGLAGGLAAAELLGHQNTPRQVTKGQPDDRLGRVTFAVMDEFVTRGCPERVLDPGVQVGERLENVLSGEALRDGLRHGVRGRRS
jgi:hypothetical protein